MYNQIVKPPSDPCKPNELVVVNVIWVIKSRSVVSGFFIYTNRQ